MARARECQSGTCKCRSGPGGAGGGVGVCRGARSEVGGATGSDGGPSRPTILLTLRLYGL